MPRNFIPSVAWMGLEQPEIPTGEEGEKNGMPGFEVAFGIAGLLAVVYLLRRKNERQKI